MANCPVQPQQGYHVRWSDANVAFASSSETGINTYWDFVQHAEPAPLFSSLPNQLLWIYDSVG